MTVDDTLTPEEDGIESAIDDVLDQEAAVELGERFPGEARGAISSGDYRCDLHSRPCR